MLSLKKVVIYEVTVELSKGRFWQGLFNFHPNSEDVEIAIRSIIDEFDKDDDYDTIGSLRQILELVTFQKPKLLGEVRIAGTYVGEISIDIIKVFAQKKQSID